MRLSFTGPDGYNGKEITKCVEADVSDSEASSAEWGELLYKMLEYRDVRVMCPMEIMAEVFRLFDDGGDETFVATIHGAQREKADLVQVALREFLDAIDA